MRESIIDHRSSKGNLHDNDEELGEDVGGEDLQGKHPNQPGPLQQALW